MNTGLIFSYVIAGMLLLIILTTGYNLSYSSNELSTTQIKKNHSNAVTDILTYDIPKIGFNTKSVITTKFIKADSNEIKFYSNIDNSSDKSVETIEWKYTDTPAPGSKNPHDHILTRTVDGVETNINLGVTKFTIRYYDEYGSDTPLATPVSTSDLDNIKQIEIDLILESSYALKYRSNSNENYIASSWTKRFSPINLRNK